MGKLTFVLHDESVNTYGFRMLTSGANLEEFKKNPVMLLNHDDYSLPIGRWENIRVEGGKILADAVFDEGDARAAEVKRKVENDFIRMASIGAWPPEEKSDAYDLMLPGQTLPTVTRWTVREGSVVTIGANHNALVFYDRESAVDKMNEAKKESQKREAVSLTDAAIKDGRYDAKGRENLLNLFDKDFEGTKAMLAAIPCRANVAGQINTDKGSGVTLGDWKDKSWDELDKAGKLVELKDAAPDLYKSKFKERFGIEPNL